MGEAELYPPSRLAAASSSYLRGLDKGGRHRCRSERRVISGSACGSRHLMSYLSTFGYPTQNVIIHARASVSARGFFGGVASACLRGERGRGGKNRDWWWMPHTPFVPSPFNQSGHVIARPPGTETLIRPPTSDPMGRRLQPNAQWSRTRSPRSRLW